MMKALYICSHCGFISTIWKDNYIYTHGEVHCLLCAEKDHGTLKGA